ncbi:MULTISPECIES: hypothetical protein [unclassified Streptomyces]|uniref:hypothetical protein n=1 Tax=unclassified Streptomyces TaxID=2593676 RepID=UPI00365ECA07
MRAREETVETEARVRQLLGPADPLADRVVTSEADRVVLARVLATDPRPRGWRRADAYRPRRRRGWVVAVATVTALAGAGLAAQASGIIPDNVIWGLNRAGHGPGAEGLEADIANARKLFQGKAPNGDLLEYWQAPNPSGGQCAYLRVIDAKSGGSDGESSCFRGGENYDPPAVWAEANTNALDDWTALYGKVPDSAVSVRVTFEDGGVVGPVKADARHYFLTFLPLHERSNWDWAAYKTEALDAEGKVVATERSYR